MMALSVTLELLYKLYSKAGTPPVTSWIVQEKDFSRLIAGQVHPLSLDNGSVTQLWWEDFWDDSMKGRNTYWSGWGDHGSYWKAISLTEPYSSSGR